MSHLVKAGTPTTHSDPWAPLLLSRSILELAAMEWLGQIMDDKFDDLYASLESGFALCTLANMLRPGIIQKINMQRSNQKDLENLSSYLNACNTLGIPPQNIFTISDLTHKNDLTKVLRNVLSLAEMSTNIGSFAGVNFCSVLHNVLSQQPAHRRSACLQKAGDGQGWVVFEDNTGVDGDWGAWITWGPGKLSIIFKVSSVSPVASSPPSSPVVATLFGCTSANRLTTSIQLDLDDVELEKDIPSSLKIIFINKSGWMYKMGAVRKNWKVRWFAVAGGILCYYLDKSGQKLLGRIDISKAISMRPLVLKKFPYAIELVTPNRTYLFGPDSEGEQVSWLEACSPFIRPLTSSSSS
eukprot:TRINITY_DN12966_c0_g1_i1.p1 TRINITY_DN12966_c0_g1~~TRINITY_DN12966_c0_g1_i1.p1  ORF type:complete len:373 (+),score=90.67 TRINITY_DN12966_c0_g1_i1:59-1120(+)